RDVEDAPPRRPTGTPVHGNEIELASLAKGARHELSAHRLLAGPLLERAALAVSVRQSQERRAELLRCDRVIALVDPSGEQLDGDGILRLEARRHPARLAEAVVRRLREGEQERVGGGIGELRRQAESVLLERHEDEGLPLDLDRAMAPGEVLGGLGIGEGQLAQGGLGLAQALALHAATPCLARYSSARRDIISTPIGRHDSSKSKSAEWWGCASPFAVLFEPRKTMQPGTRFRK